jgi:hypothetical protein
VVEREWTWVNRDQRGADRVVTGADGSFHFPSVPVRSLFAALVPAEPLIEQAIRITVEGRAHSAWEATKRSYAENGELGGRPIRLRCDLGAAPERTMVDDDITRSFRGICRLE